MRAGLLQAELAQDRPAHAYLLTGPDPGTLHEAAIMLAQALNCRAPQPTGPCGVCRNCLEITAGVFADLHLGAARRKLGEVKGQLALLVEKPFVGRRRVVVLPGVPDMTREAQNVLLKTLEEPPPASVLILTAPSAEGILPTVVSRCRHVPVPGPSSEQVAADLIMAGAAPDAAWFAALAAGGDRPAAVRLAARDDLPELRADALAFALGALGQPRAPALELVDKHQRRLSQPEEVTDWLAAIRCVLRAVIADGAGDGSLLRAAFPSAAAGRLRSVDAPVAADMLEAVQAVEVAATRHAAVRLAMEAALLSLYDRLDAGH